MNWRVAVLYICAFLVAAECYGALKDWWGDLHAPAGKIVYETYSDEAN
jgi:hypothetical protein